MSNPKIRRMGIMLRIALLAWLVTLMTVGIFVSLTIPEQKRIFVENLESKANGVAVSIRDVAAGAVVNEDYGSLVEHCLQMLKGDKSIDYLVITKNSGESWIHDKSGWRFSQLPPEWHSAIRIPTSGIGIVPEFHRRAFHYSQPFDYSGIQWGWIHVGLSLETYDHSVASLYRRTGFLALFCIVVSLFASGLYARLFVRPIMSLQSVVRQIAQGDLSARVVIQTGDEVELLADSFNTMADNLLQRDRILGSVQFASQQFLAAADWQTVAAEVLTRIGQAAEICRAHIFENHAGPDGGLLMNQRFEYTAHAEAPLHHGPTVQDIPWNLPGLDQAMESLKERRVFCGFTRQLTPVQQPLPARQKVQSLLLAPIWVENAWWGHLEFNDCTRERVWTEAEADSLRTLADMLGAAIARQRIEDALLEAKLTLEQRVIERTSELQEQVAATQKAHADLAAAQQELIVASREAGMAEVATGVLHNVGNVLNSVNVSTTLIREKLERSEVSTLGQVRGLLEEHENDFAGFLTADPKGQLVPGLIVQLAERLESERAGLLAEHAHLARNVEHIKEIVSMQQNYARVSGFRERVSISNLLDDALQLNTAGLARHGITVIRQYSDVPPFTADKHKVLQILVNLIHNAKYALDASSNLNKRLKAGISLNGGNQVKVTVEDNGVGIPPENLTRIFSHRFTTRKHGHGFGLHSGANAAKEMGGKLTAYSEGPGKGALFILELPLEGQAVAEAMN